MDWQKDVLAQLRQAHFGLVSLSFALLIAATLIPAASLQDAYQQLQTIENIRSKYFNFEHALPRAEARDIDFLGTRDKYQPLRLMAISGKIADELRLTIGNQRRVRIGTHRWSRSFTIDGAKHPAYVLLDSSAAAFPLGQQNLAQFREAWDFLERAQQGKIHEVLLDQASAYRYGEEVELAQYRVSGEPSTEQASTDTDPLLLAADFSLVEVRNTAYRLSPPEWFIVVEFKSDDLVGLPLNAVHIPIDVSYLSGLGSQSMLLPAEDPTIPFGPFNRAFGDLARLTEGLESLTIDSLLDYVRRLRDESDEQIQLLGVQIPRSTIRQWGILILFVFQVYFLLHLGHVRSRAFSQVVVENFPWIGLYANPIAGTTFVLSISLLPASAIATLLWSTSTSSFISDSWWLVSFWLFGGLLLVGLSIRLGWALRQELLNGALEARNATTYSNRFRRNGHRGRSGDAD